MGRPRHRDSHGSREAFSGSDTTRNLRYMGHLREREREREREARRADEECVGLGLGGRGRTADMAVIALVGGGSNPTWNGT